MARPRDHQRDHQVDAHEALDNDGFVAVPGVLDAPQARLAVAILGDLVAESRRQPGGAAEGHADKLTGGTLHREGLEHRGTALPAVWEDPGVVAAVRHHLGPAAALRTATYRAPLPGRGGQTLHVDWAGFVAEGDWQVCNAIVALVDFTAANGATRVVPGTHRHPDRRFRPRSPLDRHPASSCSPGRPAPPSFSAATSCTRARSTGAPPPATPCWPHGSAQRRCRPTGSRPPPPACPRPSPRRPARR